MNDLPDLPGGAEERSGLRARARSHEIDRRTSSLSFRLGFLRWLVLPAFYVVLSVMVVALLLGYGQTEEMIGGIIAVGGAAAGFFQWIRQLREELSDLEEERSSSRTDLPTSSGEAGGPSGRLDGRTE
jgi:hypothetical protein